MTAIRVIITLFVITEAMNVIALYFFPDTWYANSVGTFKAWERSKADPEIHDFVRYLVNWVAGTKLIFIGLLVTILWTADDTALFATAVVMAVAISSFFWRLFPLARRIDAAGMMHPAGYSKVLGIMIAAMIAAFMVALLLSGTP